MYPMEYARGSLIIKEGDVGSIVYVMEGESKDIRFPPKKCSFFPNFPDLWPSGGFFFGGGREKGRGGGSRVVPKCGWDAASAAKRLLSFPFPFLSSLARPE